MCSAESSNSAKAVLGCVGDRGCIVHSRREVRWRPLSSENIYHNTDLRNVNGSGKVIVDPLPAADQHQNLLTSRGSSVAQAYHNLVDVR